MAFAMPAIRASELLVAAGHAEEIGPDEAAPAEFEIGREPGHVAFLQAACDGANVTGRQDAVGEGGARPLQHRIGGGVFRCAIQAGKGSVPARQLIGEGTVQLG
jgi:hypothetical protein